MAGVGTNQIESQYFMESVAVLSGSLICTHHLQLGGKSWLWVLLNLCISKRDTSWCLCNIYSIFVCVWWSTFKHASLFGLTSGYVNVYVWGVWSVRVQLCQLVQWSGLHEIPRPELFRGYFHWFTTWTRFSWQARPISYRAPLTKHIKKELHGTSVLSCVTWMFVLVAHSISKLTPDTVALTASSVFQQKADFLNPKSKKSSFIYHTECTT